jgi:hypothetical protein
MDMDFIQPAVEGLLVVLLAAALLYGVKLDRKLKVLRETQAGFAEAVRTLDVAAQRAETGLDTLRRTAEDAHDGLHGRIGKARELKTELEGLIAHAERAAETLRTATAAAPAPKLAFSAPEPRGRVVFTAPPAPEEAPLELTEIAPEPARPEPMRSMSMRADLRPKPSRSAARGLDEDLFENPAPASAPRSRRIFGVRS